MPYTISLLIDFNEEPIEKHIQKKPEFLSVSWKRQFRKKYGAYLKPSTYLMPLILVCLSFVTGIIGAKIYTFVYTRFMTPQGGMIYEDAPHGASAGALLEEPWLISGGEADEEVVLSEDVATFWRGYDFTETDQTVTFGGDIISDYAILVDADTGEIVASRNADVKMYPASMTKVMTILTAAESIDEENLEDDYTISADDIYEAYNNDCAAVGYLEGDVVTVRDMFYGTILPSGADAASGLACYVAGDVETFVERMNAEAKKLGIDDSTHFSNPIGYFTEDNYTTAADMAAIMKAALENDICREVLGTRTYRGTSTTSYPSGVYLTNKFLRRIDRREVPGVVSGAKTGYVSESLNCAVTYLVANNGGHYICVTAHGPGGGVVLNEHTLIYNVYCQ